MDQNAAGRGRKSAFYPTYEVEYWKWGIVFILLWVTRYELWVV